MVVIASNGTVDIGWLMYRVLEELTASKNEFVILSIDQRDCYLS